MAEDAQKDVEGTVRGLEEGQSGDEGENGAGSGAEGENDRSGELMENGKAENGSDSNAKVIRSDSHNSNYYYLSAEMQIWRTVIIPAVTSYCISPILCQFIFIRISTLIANI
jgi:hypothetical protein